MGRKELGDDKKKKRQLYLLPDDRNDKEMAKYVNSLIEKDRQPASREHSRDVDSAAATSDEGEMTPDDMFDRIEELQDENYELRSEIKALKASTPELDAAYGAPVGLMAEPVAATDREKHLVRITLEKYRKSLNKEFLIQRIENLKA